MGQCVFTQARSSTAAPTKESRGSYGPNTGREGGRLARRFRAKTCLTHRSNLRKKKTANGGDLRNRIRCFDQAAA